MFTNLDKDLGSSYLVSPLTSLDNFDIIYTIMLVILILGY